MLLTALVAVSAAAAVLLLGTLWMHSDNRVENAAVLLGSLKLSHLAVSPTGRPFRAPEFLRPGTDLRYSPWIPFSEPYPEYLIFSRPNPNSTGEGRR
jgi:hypothetical protein